MCEQLPKAGRTIPGAYANSGAVAKREMTGKEIIADVARDFAMDAGAVIAQGPRVTLQQLRNMRIVIDEMIHRYTTALERMPEEARREGYRAGLDEGFADGRRQTQGLQAKSANIDGDRRMVGPDRAETRVAGQEQPGDPNRYDRPSDRLMARDLAKD